MIKGTFHSRHCCRDFLMARQQGFKIAQISRLLNGKQKFTLETMASVRLM